MYCQPEENRLFVALVLGGGSGVCALQHFYSAISCEELEQLLGCGEALLHLLSLSWEPALPEVSVPTLGG